MPMIDDKNIDILDRLRSRAALNFMMLSTVLAFTFVMLMVAIQATNSLPGAVVFLVSVAVGWFLIYLTAYEMAGLLVNLVLLLSIFWFVIFSGGFHSPLLIWLACPPLLVGLLVNWRWSLIAGVAVLLFLVGLKLTANHLVHLSEFSVTHVSGMNHTVAFVSVLSALGTVIFFSWQNHLAFTAAVSDARHKERTDSLTGILNRAGFNQFVMALSKAKPDEAGALIMFDVDDFKLINDNHGHIFGDYVLQEIASQVITVIRESDGFSRIGGDEFAVILPNAPHHHAVSVGERIKDTIDAFHFKTACGEKVRVAVSVGVATCEDAEICQTEPMMHLADKALYEAKSNSDRLAVKRLEQFPYVDTALTAG